jgi:hypothetical protein
MPLRAHECKQLRLLKMRMKLHLVDCRTNLRILKHQLKLGDGHIGGADVANQAHV